MEGDREGALQAYSRAVDALLKCGDGPERKNLLVQSYLCKAYALCDGEQWQEAVDAFEAVLPLLEGEQRSENYKQLGRCYDELGMTAKADECWKESGFPRVRRSSPGTPDGRRQDILPSVTDRRRCAVRRCGLLILLDLCPLFGSMPA